MHEIDAYCELVASGRRLAGKYHRLACDRHRRDRDRAGTRKFPYVFDDARADRFIRFAERLQHYKGKWAGENIILQPHQKYRLGSLFAWVHQDTELRRFRTSYDEMPRKQGKSLEAAVVALYVTFFDGEMGAEGYCIATKKDQALIVFTDCKKLVRHSKLRTRIDGSFAKHGALTREEVDAKLLAIGSDADSTDGLNPNLVIVDEFHAHKHRDLVDVMETALGARDQPLMFQITTAGNDPITPCGDQHHYATQVLDRVLDDESFFAFIAHADPDDNSFDERTWKKANPNYGISVNPEDLRALARKARNLPAAKAAFDQKRLNLWTHSATPWLSVDGWRRGQTAGWTADDMVGKRCWVGIDMSSKIDLTAVAFLFPPELPDRRAWRVIAICLTPEETLEDREHRDRAPYAEWVKKGWLRTNPGMRIDQDAVVEIVNEAQARYHIMGIGLDPWNAGNLMKDLSEEGHLAIEIPQTMQQMSQPSKEFEADVLEGMVDSGGNVLLQWCVSNAVVQRDNKDNIFPVKGKSRGRIDPVMATLLARKLAGLNADNTADDPELVVA